MEGARLVNEIIQTFKPQEILDLRCRKGYFSILAASYGAHVDVVDNPQFPEFPDYLKQHPNIMYYNSPLEEFSFEKNYNFIIMKHVVLFYPKDFVFQKLLSQVYDHLVVGGLAFITFHFADSYVMKSHPEYYLYTLNDFKSTNLNFFFKDFWEYFVESQQVPYEQEHIGYIVLQKR